MIWDWRHFFGKLYEFNRLEESQDISLDLLRKTLRSQTIQDRWLDAMAAKLGKINIELDHLLEKPDRDRIWEVLAIERRTMLRCLTMIMDMRDEIESERVTQEAQNKLFERYRGVNAPLPLQ